MLHTMSCAAGSSLFAPGAAAVAAFLSKKLTDDAAVNGVPLFLFIFFLFSIFLPQAAIILYLGCGGRH